MYQKQDAAYLFSFLKKRLEEAKRFNLETGHMQADTAIREVALYPYFTQEQRVILIDLYDQIAKEYSKPFNA